MQPIERLSSGLAPLASRAVTTDVLQRLCRGIYLYPHVISSPALVLYHAIARLRADTFNYLNLKSVLSDVGVISQLPLNWITLMSSGRSLDLVDWAVAKELGA